MDDKLQKFLPFIVAGLAALLIYVAIDKNKTKPILKNLPGQHHEWSPQESWDSKQQPAPEEELPPEETLPPGKVVNDYEEALAAAKENNQLIFLIFHTNTCPNCRTMEETLNNDNVKAAMKNVIICSVDANAEKRLSRKYKIQVVPAYFMVDGNETILNHGTGAVSEQVFVDWLNRKWSGHHSWR